MENQIPFVDILKIFAFMIILILPPWFAFLGQFRGRFSGKLKAMMTLAYAAIAGFALVFSPYTQQLLPFILVLATLWVIRTRRSGGEVQHYLRSIKGRKAKIVWYAILFKIGTVLLTAYFVYELAKFGIEIKEQEISNELMNSDWITTIILSIIASVFAPVLEEFVFRHIFYRGFSKKIGHVFAAILSSLMFTALHFNIASSAAIFAVGLFNCYLYEREGYRAAVLSHFVFNFSTLLVVIGVKLSGVDLSQFGFIFIR